MLGTRKIYSLKWWFDGDLPLEKTNTLNKSKYSEGHFNLSTKWSFTKSWRSIQKQLWENIDQKTNLPNKARKKKWITAGSLKTHLNKTLPKECLFQSKKDTTHPNIAHPFGNPPATPTMKGIPLKGPFGKGCSGCVPKVCWNNLRFNFPFLILGIWSQCVLKTAVFLDTKSGVTTLTLEVPGVSNFHAGIGEMEWILRVGKAVEVGAKQIQQKNNFLAQEIVWDWIPNSHHSDRWKNLGILSIKNPYQKLLAWLDFKENHLSFGKNTRKHHENIHESGQIIIFFKSAGGSVSRGFFAIFTLQWRLGKNYPMNGILYMGNWGDFTPRSGVISLLYVPYLEYL